MKQITLLPFRRIAHIGQWSGVWLWLAYQYVREPLRAEEADSLCHACEMTEEKLIIWTLLDTGLRVSELCSLTPQHVLWQQKAFRVEGKGGPYGKQSKKRIVPMSRRIMPLHEHYFALHGEWFAGKRQVQKIVKQVANHFHPLEVIRDWNGDAFRSIKNS
ncbi:MAG TPA: tyrosine-type recombinase/integrase [Ktedonobacteraceae bacterium]|nr:tyrosine-type recombinase/integrase [Ktedonobacteraceae bacterium]